MKKINCNCALGESENFTTAKLSQHFILVEDRRQELDILLYYLEALEYRQAIIFTRDSIRCAHLADYLTEHGRPHPKTVAIHGNLSLAQRMARHKQFQFGTPQSKILVTSCCSHGMECRDVDVIINFDEAESPARYYHRICSKATRKGLILNFIREPKFLRVLKKVTKLYNVTVSPLPSFLMTHTYIDFSDPEPGHTNNIQNM